MKKLPKAWRCPKCKHANLFSVWVYAHWDEDLTGRCTRCQHVVRITAGKIKR